MANDPTIAWTEVYCLRDYNPYRVFGQRNPAFNKETDGKLLDLKDNKPEGVATAVNDFKKCLDALDLPRGTIVVIVPGHVASASNTNSPLASVAKGLAQTTAGLVASVDTLIRSKTVPKKATGGIRGADVDEESITVTNPSSLAGATMVVLDDTATTGGTLTAARRLLTAAGATKVATVAIARTVKYL